MKKLSVSLAIALLCGCGGDSNTPRTYSATGIVTLNGQPVEGATVNFHPIDGKASAVGVTDATGMYTLTTHTANDGALPGKYKVSIAKVEDPNAKPITTPPEGVLASGELDAATYAPPPETGGATMPMRSKRPKLVIPAKYSDPESSQLTAEIKESDTNEINFELK